MVRGVWVFVVFRFEGRVPVDCLEVVFLLVRYVLLFSFLFCFLLSLHYLYIHISAYVLFDCVLIFFLSLLSASYG